MQGPDERSNWIIKNRLLVSSYPYGESTIKTYINSGINVFVNLTEDKEKVKEYNYYNFLPDKIKYVKFPMPDMSTTDDDMTNHFVDELALLYESGSNILVHCKGGIGRTGVIVCLLLSKLKYCENSTIIEYVNKCFADRVIKNRKGPKKMPQTRIQIGQVKRLLKN
jgi:protein-tyrosine phosphatase